MNLITLIVPIILGLAIGITSRINTTDEPKYIQVLGTLTACIISYPIMMVFSILT